MIVVDPNPRWMPDAGLLCAIKACQDSDHESDRVFALECAAEIKRRAAALYERFEERREAA